jgi:hypothetical protein
VAEQNRRKYRRIRAPLYWRPAGMEFLARQRQPIDVSLGGVRIYSDDPLKIGELLKMEFFTLGALPVTYTAEVVWIEPMEAGSPARFDVGLKFLQLEPEALKMLVSALGPLEDSQSASPDDSEKDDPKSSAGADSARSADSADSARSPSSATGTRPAGAGPPDAKGDDAAKARHAADSGRKAAK